MQLTIDVALLRQIWHILTQRQKVQSFSTVSAESCHLNNPQSPNFLSAAHKSTVSPRLNLRGLILSTPLGSSPRSLDDDCWHDELIRRFEAALLPSTDWHTALNLPQQDCAKSKSALSGSLCLNLLKSNSEER